MFAKFYWKTVPLIHLQITYDCFCRLSRYGLQRQTHLLSGPLQKKFVNPSSRDKPRVGGKIFYLFNTLWFFQIFIAITFTFIPRLWVRSQGIIDYILFRDEDTGVWKWICPRFCHCQVVGPELYPSFLTYILRHSHYTTLFSWMSANCGCPKSFKDSLHIW